MRAYGIVAPTFWTRGTGKRLRGHKEAQIVAFHLMTSPHTSMIGVFPLSLPTLCHETGLSVEEAREGLTKCADEQFAFWDEDGELIFVPALAHHQLGERLKKNDHRIKGVRRALAPFKGHRFYDLFVERYADLYLLNEAPTQAPSKAPQRGDVPDPVPDPDPDRGERERGSRSTAPSAAPPAASSGPAAADTVAIAEVFEAWRRETGHAEARPDEKRLGIIAARLREGRSPDELVTAIRHRVHDPWLMGENERGRVYDGIETLLRDAAQVERLLALTRPEKPKGGPARASAPRYRDLRSNNAPPMALGETLAALALAQKAAGGAAE